MKLSAVLIVKNEEALLDRCLKSIQGADEIVICDTGSTDATIEIASKYGKVFTDYQWNQSFAEARNYAKSKATGDWILSIDADEVLQTAMQDVKDAIEKADGDALSVAMFSENTMFNFPRIFKNVPDIQWKGAAHNYLTGVKKESISNIRIYFGYSPNHALDKDRTFNILKKAVHDGLREKFYLAREYTYRSEWGAAAYWLDEYLKNPTWIPEYIEALLLKARCLWQLQRGNEARATCAQAIAINTNFKEAILFMAEMSGPINKKRWTEFADNADNSNVLFVRTKDEKKADYYNQLFSNQSDFSRYDAIHRMIGEWVGNKKVLDIGCGRGDVAKYIENYSGFDFSEEGIKHAPNAWVGDIYDLTNYKDVDIYLILEVLEHVDDRRVLNNIPPDKEIIFSVPSFDDPSHLRTYDEEKVRNLGLNIKEIVRFNWHGKWTLGKEDTDSYILLVKADNYANV